MAPVSLKWDETSLHENRFVRDEDERPKVPYNKFSNEIPVISLEGIDDVEGRRAEICDKIVKACEDWGIFQVVDHGVDTKLLSEMTRLARQFFDLPTEEKLQFDMTGGKKGGFIVSSHLQVSNSCYCFLLIYFWFYGTYVAYHICMIYIYRLLYITLHKSYIYLITWKLIKLSRKN